MNNYNIAQEHMYITYNTYFCCRELLAKGPLRCCLGWLAEGQVAGGWHWCSGTALSLRCVTHQVVTVEVCLRHAEVDALPEEWPGDTWAPADCGGVLLVATLLAGHVVPRQDGSALLLLVLWPQDGVEGCGAVLEFLSTEQVSIW